jgi:large subunit ribosomal protein L4
MMELQVTTLDGGADGSVTLKDEIFGLEVRPDILHRMVRYQQL